MGKDFSRKTRGSWWYGWVRFTYLHYDNTQRDGYRTTDLDFATASLAHREAEALAGSLTATRRVGKWERGYRSKTDPALKSRITIVEIGASRAPDG